MKTIKFYLSILLCLCASVGRSEPYEKITLQNGSELYGLITSQHPGKSITFVAEKSVIYLPSQAIQKVIPSDKEVKTLSPLWQEWADSHPSAVSRKKGTSFLTLSHVILQPDYSPSSSADSVASPPSSGHISWLSSSPRDVRILEQGSVVKFLDLSDRTYHIPLAEVRTIGREKRGPLELNGIVDVIETRSGQQYEGQIVEQTPGRQIRLLCTDGMVQVISLSQIAVQKRKKLNPDQPLLCQSPVLETIRTRQGKVLTGIIVEQNYGSKGKPGFILVDNGDGRLTKEQNSQIVNILKTYNDRFTPLTDITVREDEVWINRQKAGYTKLIEENSLLLVDHYSRPFIVQAAAHDNQMEVELQDCPDNHGIIFLQLRQVEMTGKGAYYAFSYEDLVSRSIQPLSTAVSANHTLKFTFPANEGYYILFWPQSKKMVYLRID